MANDTKWHDDRLDLTLTRTIDAPRTLIWQVWTDPVHVKKWWVPKPWTTVECDLDPRPGGIFRTVMRSPEGRDHPGVGCFLDVVRNEKIVWTSALGPGYRPAAGESGGDCDMLFTAILTLEERAGKTHYAVRVLHRSEAERKKHEDMGFHLGWNQCLDQLIDLLGQLRR